LSVTGLLCGARQRDRERTLIKNMPARAAVDDGTRNALAGLTLGDPELLGEGTEMRAEWQAGNRPGSRSFSLVKLAA
jgi:hypothetical protein